MKNGIFSENGELIYYKNDKPYHAGVVKIENKVYYVSSGGKVVTGRHIVHSEMANGILKRGTYTFGEDGVLVKGSYIAPKKYKKSAKRTSVSRKNVISKKTVKRLLSLFLAIALFVVFVIAIHLFFDSGFSHTEVSREQSIADNMVILPTFEEQVLLCSDGAYKFHNGEITMKDAVKTGNPYVPFVFEYSIAMDGLLVLSENAELSDSKEFVLSSSATELKIDNLKTGTKYYYKVVIDDIDYVGNFETASSTRFVNIPGAVNARDIGGYTTLDGKKVKQGMIIRGSEIDGLVQPQYFINESDVEIVMETFGFVYDFDLRYDTIFIGEYTSRFGEDVKHNFYSSPMYGEIFNRNYQGALINIFSDLAKPENYPMYLHCTYGADRTGTIVFLLQGILNMSNEEMNKEYQRTAYIKADTVDSAYLNAIYSALESVEGGTIQEKIVNYLVNDVGVPQSDIDSIRKILLE